MKLRQIHSEMDINQRGLASISYKFFNKRTGSRTPSIARANVHEMLAQEFHITVVKKVKRRKVYARFRENIQAIGLAEMESLFCKNEGVKYLLWSQMFSPNIHGLNLQQKKKQNSF